MARRAGTSKTAVSAYESGSRTPTVQVLARLLAAMNLQLVLTTEPYLADVDTEIDRLSAMTPAERLLRVPYLCDRLDRLMDGIPYAIDGPAACLPQGVPAVVRRLEIRVADRDDVLLKLAERFAEKARMEPPQGAAPPIAARRPGLTVIDLAFTGSKD